MAGRSDAGTLNAMKGCDRLTEKKTKGLAVPECDIEDHFITLYMKSANGPWQKQAYKCWHCDKIAGTTPEIAKKHLLICKVVKRENIEL